MRYVAAPFFALVMMTAWPAHAQSPRASRPLFDTSGLHGWTATNTDSKCVRNEAGTITLRECAGWLRTDHILADYTISFEVRVQTTDIDGFFGLLGVDGPHQRTEVMVALPIAGAASAPRPSSITVVPVVLSPSARERAMKPAGEWNAYTVTRNATGVRVLLNGLEIANSGPMRASDGWLGFRADSGELEVRNVQLRVVSPTNARMSRGQPGELVDGAYRWGNGVTLPKLLKEVKPAYTSEAMSHHIQGAVLLECIVGPNGQISEAIVIRSLDPEFGLDDNAIAAARQWRFQPGTRDGSAVPVWITIELSFTLKK